MSFHSLFKDDLFLFTCLFIEVLLFCRPSRYSRQSDWPFEAILIKVNDLKPYFFSCSKTNLTWYSIVVAYFCIFNVLQ